MYEGILLAITKGFWASPLYPCQDFRFTKNCLPTGIEARAVLHGGVWDPLGRIAI